MSSDAAFIVAKDHVHDPVQRVLHRPMMANDGAHLFGWQRQRGDEEAGLGFGPVLEFANALDHDDAFEAGPVMAFL